MRSIHIQEAQKKRDARIMWIEQRRLKSFWLIVLLATAPLFNPVGAGAQSLSAEQLYGCWRREAPRRLELPQRQAFVDLCFRTDGTVYQVDIAPEGGGDDLFNWTILNERDLVINRQTCGADIQQRQDGRFMFLDTCVYMGAWTQICARMDSNGFGCARKE
jgi:hypothetical protein